MRGEDYQAIAKKFAQQMKDKNPGLANILETAAGYSYKTKEGTTEFIHGLQAEVVKQAEEALDREMLRKDSDRMPSESILEYLNVFAFLRKIADNLPNEKVNTKLTKKLEDALNVQYGFFFAVDEVYQTYYQKMQTMYSAGDKPLTLDDYRSAGDPKGLIEMSNDMLYKEDKSRGLYKNHLIEPLMYKAFSDYDHGILQITRPTGSNEKFAKEIVPGMTFSQVVRSSREFMGRNIAFQKHNSFILDQFLFALSGYIRNGHRPEDIRDEAELDTILSQMANLHTDSFNPAAGEDIGTLTRFCDFMQELIAQPEQYDVKMQTNLSERMSFAMMNFLRRPAVKDALLNLKREPGNDLEFARNIFMVMEKNGLLAQMDELEKHTNRESGACSMTAIRQMSEENRRNPHIPFLGVSVLSQLKNYVHELALRGADNGLIPKVPVKEIKGQKVPEEWQELEAYVPGCWEYMRLYDAFSKNPTAQNMYDFTFAAEDLSKSIGTVFGDTQLMEDFRLDAWYARRYQMELTQKEKEEIPPAFGSFGELKEYMMLSGRLNSVPYLFECALANLGIWLRHHSLDELTVDVLSGIDAVFVHDFTVATNDKLLGTTNHNNLRYVLEKGIQELPTYFRHNYNSYDEKSGKEPFSPEIAEALNKINDPQWEKQPFAKNFGLLKDALGQMQKAGIFELALKVNDKHLNPDPADGTENVRLLLERCRKLLGDASFVKGLTDNKYFCDAWKMAEGHDFTDFLSRLNGAAMSEDPFVLTPEILSIAAEARRSMSIVFSASLDAEEKDLRQLFEIMMQIKRPEKNIRFDDKINPDEFMQMTDLFCENPLSAQMDPIIEDFNMELAFAPEADKMKKVSKNVYKNKVPEGKLPQKHTFKEFAKLVFVNCVQDNLPYVLVDAWNMSTYNKKGQPRVMSDNESVYQTITRYKQMANYLPYLGKLYTRDQKNTEGVSEKEINDKPEKYRTGTFIMSNVVNLQAHDTMNSPAMEAYYAANVISIMDREFKATVNDPKLRKEFYKALSSNVCFDERASDFVLFSAKRAAAQGTPAKPTEDGTLYFRTDETDRLVQTMASTATSMMQAVLAVWGSLKDDYSEIIPLENFTVDMVRPLMTRIFVDGKLEFEGSPVTQKSLDHMLENLRAGGVFRDDYANDEEIRNAILEEMKGAGYVWDASWSVYNENEAKEYARKLLGFHRVSGWLANHENLLEELAGMPDEKTRKEQREKLRAEGAKPPVQRGFANNAGRQRLEANLQKALIEADKIRWREMEGGNGYIESQARNMEYGTGIRYDSFHKLFEGLNKHYATEEAINLMGSNREKEALKYIKEILQLPREDFATIFVNAGTAQEEKIVDAAQWVMHFCYSRYTVASHDDMQFNGEVTRLFRAAFPRKSEYHEYNEREFMTVHDRVPDMLKKFVERFEKAMPGFYMQDDTAAKALLARLAPLQKQLEYTIQHRMRIRRSQALTICNVVHSFAAMMMAYMNPADQTEEEWRTLQDEFNYILESLKISTGSYNADNEFDDLHLNLDAVIRLSKALHESTEQSSDSVDDLYIWLNGCRRHHNKAVAYLKKSYSIKLDTEELDVLHEDIKDHNKKIVRSEDIRNAYQRSVQRVEEAKQKAEQDSQWMKEIVNKRSEQAAQFRQKYGNIVNQFENNDAMYGYLKDFIQGLKKVRKQASVTLSQTDPIHDFLNAFDETMISLDKVMAQVDTGNTESVLQVFTMTADLLDHMRELDGQYRSKSVIDLTLTKAVAENLTLLQQFELLDEKFRSGVSVTSKDVALELIAAKMLAYDSRIIVRGNQKEKENALKYFTDAANRKMQINDLIKDQYFVQMVQWFTKLGRLGEFRDEHAGVLISERYQERKNLILEKEAKAKAAEAAKQEEKAKTDKAQEEPKPAEGAENKEIPEQPKQEEAKAQEEPKPAEGAENKEVPEQAEQPQQEEVNQAEEERLREEQVNQQKESIQNLAKKYPKLYEQANTMPAKELKGFVQKTFAFFKSRIRKAEEEKSKTKPELGNESAEYQDMVVDLQSYFDEMESIVKNLNENDPDSIKASLYDFAQQLSETIESKVGNSKDTGYIYHGKPLTLLQNKEVVEHLTEANMYYLYVDLFCRGIDLPSQQARGERIAMAMVYAQANEEWNSSEDMNDPKKKAVAEVFANFKTAKERMKAIMQNPVFQTVAADKDKVQKLLNLRGAALLTAYGQAANAVQEVKPEAGPKAEKKPAAQDQAAPEGEQPHIKSEYYINFVKQFNGLKKMLEKTGSTSGSPEYGRLKQVVAQWSARFTPEMVARLNAEKEASAEDIRTLCSALRNVSLAGEDYMKAHTPDQGNFKKASLSKRQQKRLSLINRFRQLKQLAMPGNANFPPAGYDIPDPHSQSFSLHRIALKMLNAQAMRHLDLGVNKASANKVLLAVDDTQRTAKVKELLRDDNFKIMVRQAIDSVRSQNAANPGKYPNANTDKEIVQLLADQKPERLLSFYMQIAFDTPQKQKNEQINEQLRKDDDRNINDIQHHVKK